MNIPTSRKIALIGGGGVRTPLVIFGINEAGPSLGADELVLFDLDRERCRIMADLGNVIVAQEGGSLQVRVASSIEDALDGAAFVLNSIRAGGIKARAHDERISIEQGYPGQETTGPGGIAMALRTVPIAVEQARLVEKLSPDAWLINFTNPAGLITQAIQHYSGARVVGICDTPSEMMHRINVALDAGHEGECRCEYVGLNHLGWIRRITLRGQDITESLLADDAFLSKVYSVPLFEHELIRALKLLPTEYLFFYYSRRRALENQRKQGSTRGTEIEQLNDRLIGELSQLLQEGNGQGAVAAYVYYLNVRSGSYMKLEGDAGSAFAGQGSAEDPFRAASGYHRIAIDVMNALCSNEPKRIVVNTRNQGSIDEVEPDDIVEVPCMIGSGTITPEPCGRLPEAVRGLVLAVKAYERAAIDAALTGSTASARKAMLLYPAIGEWEPSKDLLEKLIVKC